jgi:tripartite-type tricarboxylate transporter receptor subunit TctC
VRILLALAAALVALQCEAQGWPARPVHLVVPYAPGGPVDLSARLIAAKLQQALGQPVVVDNRAGAGGNIGADFVAKSAPDGHTLVMGAIATHAINPALYANFPYDPVRDFRHVALLVQVPNVLVVHNDLPVRTLQELVALAKEKPGRLDFASGSTGCTGHLAGELFKQLTGTYMVHIPYKGSAPALAVTTARRSGFLPDLQTLDEAGLKGFDMTTWWGVMAPGKTPEAVVERLAAETAKAMQDAQVAERLRAMGSEAPTVGTPAQFTAFVERERKVYGELVRRSGAKAD